MSDISINTNPDSDMFVSEYKFPEWYNKKTYIFYNKILARLNKLSYVHTRSSQYYDKMNYYIFGPSIAITAVSGIASFLSTSDFVNQDTQNGFGVAVGVIASVSSVMQAIAGACNFSAKREGHRAAAEEYNNLIVKTKFEIEMPNEEDYADKLEGLILDIQAKCNFFPPQKIVDDYNKKMENKKNESHRQHVPNYGSFNNDNVKLNINDNVKLNINDTMVNNFEIPQNDINIESNEPSNLNNIDVNNSDELPDSTV
jgi:hypothetical protein